MKNRAEGEIGSYEARGHKTLLTNEIIMNLNKK